MTVAGAPDRRVRAAVLRHRRRAAGRQLLAALAPLRPHPVRRRRRATRLDAVGLQYLLAFAGTRDPGAGRRAGSSPAARWRRIGRMTAFARRVSGERLDERLALEGPADELRELADTLDAMLDGLSESFGAQRRFVANAGHELRGPLTVIRTQAEVTLADPDASPRRAARHGRGGGRGLPAHRGAAGGPDGAGPQPARAGRAASPPTWRRAPARRWPRWPRRPAPPTCACAWTPGAAPTLGDRRLLDRLVANLVENAVRHNRPGGTVDVTTTTRNGARRGARGEHRRRAAPTTRWRG